MRVFSIHMVVDLLGGDHGRLVDARAVAEKLKAGAQVVGVDVFRHVGLEENVEHLLAGENARHAGDDALAGHVERGGLQLGVGREAPWSALLNFSASSTSWLESTTELSCRRSGVRRAA